MVENAAISKSVCSLSTQELELLKLSKEQAKSDGINPPTETMEGLLEIADQSQMSNKKVASDKGIEMSCSTETPMVSSQSKPAKPILILGMHRSGTSLLTRLISMAGLPIGPKDELVPSGDDNPSGFWENYRLTDFNNKILEQLGGTWFNPPYIQDDDWQGEKINYLQAEAKNLLDVIFKDQQWIWKDPRNCITLPFWLSLLPSAPVIIYIYRNPLSIWRSLNKRNGFTKRIAVSLWEIYTRAALKNCRSLPAFFVNYDDFIMDPALIITRIVAFLKGHGFEDIESPSDEMINGFISNDLRHWDYVDEDFYKDKEIPERAKILFQTMRSLPEVSDRFEPPPMPEHSPPLEMIFNSLRDWLELEETKLPYPSNTISYREYFQSKAQFSLNYRGWINYSQNLACHLVRWLRPRSAIHFGCSLGYLVEALRDQSIDAYGVDPSEYYLLNIRRDLTQFYSGGSCVDFPLTKKEYDLVICSEELNKYSPQELGAAVEKLSKIGRDIIITHQLEMEGLNQNLSDIDYKDTIIELFDQYGYELNSSPDSNYISEYALWFHPREKLRITFVLNTSELHGGTMVVYKHASLLCEKGHLVTIASWDPKPPSWVTLPPDIRFVYAPQHDREKFFEALPDADCIIATLWATASYVAQAPAKKGKKYYFVQHYESLWGGEPEEIEKTYYEIPLHKLVVSSWLVEILKKTFGEDSTLVLNGCDFAAEITSPSLNKNGHNIRVGMLYHEVGWKGTSDGLQAFTKLKSAHPEAELILFGTKRPKILPPGCVEFYQKPSRQELKELLMKLDIFISPSIAEGFGLPALEAMCCGIPLVLTDSGGCRDYANVKTALLSPPAEPILLGENLIKAAEDVELRNQLAKNGLAKANEFTWARASDQFEAGLISYAQQPSSPLNILYVSAGYRWADSYLDPMYIRGLKDIGNQVTVFDPRPQNWAWADTYLNLEMLDEEYKKRYKSGHGQLPSDLPSVVRSLKPDLVFFNHGLMIPAEVINDLRKYGVPTAIWMIDEPQEMYTSADRARLFDYVFLQDQGSLQYHLEKGNPNTFYLPHGLDPITHRRLTPGELQPEKYKSDVLVIGTGFPKRQKIVESITDCGFNVTVIGPYWTPLKATNLKFHSMVNFEEAAKYYRGANIVLNIHRETHDFSSGDNIPAPCSPNASYFFAMGCGSLQIVETGYPGADEFFMPRKHFKVFDSTEELLELITTTLGNPDEREHIVSNASALAHRYHKYADRFQEALTLIGKPHSHRRVFGVSPKEQNRIFPLTTIILLSRGNLDDLKSCLSVLLRAKLEPYEFNVIHPPDTTISKWLDQKRIPHLQIENDKSLVNRLNMGARIANSEYLVFISEEAIPTPGFSKHLLSVLEDHKAVAVVGPSINSSKFSQTVPVSYESVNEIVEFACREYLTARDHFQIVDQLDPICFTISQKTLQTVGDFDERYTLEQFALSDFIRRAKMLGLCAGWSRRAHVYRQTQVPGYSMNDFNLNKQLYRQKWDIDPQKESDPMFEDGLFTTDKPELQFLNPSTLLQKILEAENLALALQKYEGDFSLELLSLIRTNTDLARRDGETDLADGLVELAAYIEEVLAKRVLV